MIRGNLLAARTRADAVWELIVLEAAAQLGRVECEPPQGGPDVRLELPTGRWVSIEVRYLRPRFDDEERRSEMVTRWLNEAVALLVQNPPEIRCYFEGDSNHPAGPKRTLPFKHEQKRFLGSQEVSKFLATVAAAPSEAHQQRLSAYSVTLLASPRAPESHGYLSWGGLFQEVPRVVKEHAAFRALRAKIQQHKVDEPHLVCIGSDVSPVLSSTPPSFGISLDLALSAAVRNSGEISGVLVVNVEPTSSPWQGISRTAHFSAYRVPECRHPLDEAEWSFIQKLDFNRWKFGAPMPKDESSAERRERNLPGSFEYSPTSRGTVRVSFPASLLVEVLSGRKQLLENYGGPDEQFGRDIMKCLQAGWSVVACSFKDGSLQRAEASTVILELAPPHDPVYWKDK